MADSTRATSTVNVEKQKALRFMIVSLCKGKHVNTADNARRENAYGKPARTSRTIMEGTQEKATLLGRPFFG